MTLIYFMVTLIFMKKLMSNGLGLIVQMITLAS